MRVALVTLACCAAAAADGNRFAHLGAPSPDPYYVGADSAKLKTPSWIGEDGVEAVAILSIDDMRDTAKYETYLRPILDRLKRIDGRAPVSIFTCQVNPADPQLARWLEEGLSIEVHTIKHPCPLLGAGGSLADARATVHRCTDLLAGIPGMMPVAFRMPCCDSQNSLSPRFFAEIFSKPTPAGNLLKADSSVFTLLNTPDKRFDKYVPKLRGFVNYIEDYPYPYVIGGNCWELPCVVPSDWEAQDRHGPNNPKTVEDLKAALDQVVEMQGVFTFVFHPHGWIENRQVVELIDHAAEKHGGRLKFMTMREVVERLEKNVLGGASLHDGVRLFDADGDGTPEVHPADQEVAAAVFGKAPPRSGRLLDVDGDGQPESVSADAVFAFGEGDWKLWPTGLPEFADPGHAGTRFADLDRDGDLDLIISTPQRQEIHLFESVRVGWVKHFGGKRTGFPAEHQIPSFVGQDGSNRGSWLARGRVFWQNEDTGRGQSQIFKRTFDELLALAEAEGVHPMLRSMPLGPEASLAQVEVGEGLRVELVAAEPLVRDPIDIAWGLDGKLWVVEMADYPLGLDGKGEPGGRVRFLADDDGDGRYDRSVLVREGLNFPTAVAPWREGVLVVAAPDIFYITEGAEPELLYTGFREGNQQHRVNGLRPGLDNWIYLANGDSGGRVGSVKTGVEVELGGRDLRIRPATGELQLVTGRTQYGRSRNDWGDWFGCMNAHPLWHFMLPDRYLARNPHVASPSPTRHLFGGIGRPEVFPISETWERFNDFNTANKITSACGANIYRDLLLGEAFAGDAFVCEPVHNLVVRLHLEPEAASFNASREGAEGGEFFRSRDNWCRPVSTRTGPDGALYVVDMYRRVIEHPEWIPGEWQEKLDLREGHERGRIYRVLPAGGEARAWTGVDDDVRALVAGLGHPSGEVRDLCQQRLVGREGEGISGSVRELFEESKSAAARLHALCVLDGRGALAPEDLRRAFTDAHPGVRRHAVRLAEGFAADTSLLGDLAKLVADPDAKVRYQLAFSLGEWHAERAGDLLASLSAAEPDNRYLQAAIMSSALPHALRLLAADTVLDRDKLERSAAAEGLGAKPLEIFRRPLPQRPSREPIIERYAKVDPSTGDLEEGKRLFTIHCSTCHRYRGVGREIGPDLAALKDRSTPALLKAILDPNAALEDRFRTHAVELRDGGAAVGILAGDTSVALSVVGADGVTRAVLRKDIKSITDLGRSMMPEGLEAAISPEQMAGLLAFLQR